MKIERQIGLPLRGRGRVVAAPNRDEGCSLHRELEMLADALRLFNARKTVPARPLINAAEVASLTKFEQHFADIFRRASLPKLVDINPRSFSRRPIGEKPF